VHLGLCSLLGAKAVFLDRDGTINDNRHGYVHTIEEFEFMPGAIEALKELSKTDYRIVIVTNQSGIGRGFYAEQDFEALSDWFLSTLATEGVRIDRIYHCPHTPEDRCSCRKPEIGMLSKAVADLGISLKDSWMVGDDAKDILMGRRANMKTVKIGDQIPCSLKVQPDAYSDNLQSAVDIILSKKMARSMPVHQRVDSL